mmetsp:Transcript_22815/g.48503  ORF Transcript_22815/g.48503 Transcript_22815/m.48503 type:complete len:226 (-) Transcript_22815:2483-3160(-)
MEPPTIPEPAARRNLPETRKRDATNTLIATTTTTAAPTTPSAKTMATTATTAASTATTPAATGAKPDAPSIPTAAETEFWHGHQIRQNGQPIGRRRPSRYYENKARHLDSVGLATPTAPDAAPHRRLGNNYSHRVSARPRGVRSRLLQKMEGHCPRGRRRSQWSPGRGETQEGGSEDSLLFAPRQASPRSQRGTKVHGENAVGHHVRCMGRIPKEQGRFGLGELN